VDSIKTLSETTVTFISKSAERVDPLRALTNTAIPAIRAKQVAIDQRAVELYDITMKVSSYLCNSNRMGAQQSIRSIDRQKRYFSGEGIKGRQINSVNYVQEYMMARQPLISLFSDIESAKGGYRGLKERRGKVSGNNALIK